MCVKLIRRIRTIPTSLLLALRVGLDGSNVGENWIFGDQAPGRWDLLGKQKPNLEPRHEPLPAS